MRAPGWFLLLMRILPHDFRDRHGEEIVRLAHRYAADRNGIGRTAVWLRAAVDLVLVAFRARLGLVDELRHDIRSGLRSLRSDLAFVAFAVGMVGIGIGASVTVFSVARALLLRPLPFTEPDRLVFISNGDFGRGQALSDISVQSGRLDPLRTASTQFDDVAGYHLFDREGDHTLRYDDVVMRVTRLRVTGSLFDVLGVQPIVGRLFADEELVDDAPPVLLLTDESWARLFQRRPEVVGSTVALDDVFATVIGVLPPSFDFNGIFAPGGRIDYVTPFPLSARSNRTGNSLAVIGRLAPGATIESAQAEATALGEGMPGEWNDYTPVIRPLRDHLSGFFRPTVALLGASVLLVVLLVCANLSNLLLARSTARRREFSIRSAMGAGRGRLIRQLLMESVILAGAGSALGILVAVGGTRLLASLPVPIPMLGETRVDGPALWVALGAAALVALLFGIVPALRGSDTQPGEALRQQSRGSSSGRGQSAMRRGLVAAQVAIACLLLVGSTLTGRSLLHLLETDLGYEPSGRIAMRIDPTVRFASPEEGRRYLTDVLDQVRATPGVTAAGLTDVLPMAFNRRWGFDVEGRTENLDIFPFVRIVTEGYVDAMGLELLRGRDLTAADGPSDPRVALINEELARLVWGDGDPIGEVMRTSGSEYEIVGVVRSTRHLSVDQPPGPEFFLPMRQTRDFGAIHMVVTGGRTLADLTAIARAAVTANSANVPVDQVVSLEEVVGRTLAPTRLLVTILTGFAAVALLLAALGLYGVIAYAVTRREREIGIRVALGATSRRIELSLLREALAMTAVGLGTGLLLVLLAGGAMQSLLFGISAIDPLSMAFVATLLVAVAAIASWLPARRVLRIDPLAAVKSEG